MSFRIHRRDTEIRFAAKFGENRPLRSYRKVVWITTQKNSGSAGLVPAPILPRMGQSRPKFPECCHPSTGYQGRSVYAPYITMGPFGAEIFCALNGQVWGIF